MSAARLSLSILVYVAGMLPAMAQSEPLRVCQMLNSARERQEITVRGAIIGEPHHGYSLSEGMGNEPCPGWPKRFFTSPSAVGLTIQLTGEHGQRNRDLLRRLNTLSGEHILKPYWVTVTGFLKRRPWLRTFRHADGTYSCFGAAVDSCLGEFEIRMSVSEGN